MCIFLFYIYFSSVLLVPKVHNKQNYYMSFFNVFKVLLFLFFAGQLSAQPWFNWDYVGPDTIAVGANCKAPLNWGGQSKILCTPVNPPSQVVISKVFKSISGGYFEGSLVPAGTTVTVTYEAMDNQGHTETFSFPIYFADKTPPVFNVNSLPPDITISCATSLTQPAITASDNCTPAFQIQISSELNFPPSPCSGNYERKFIAKDAAGNQAFYIQHITLIGETIRPVITTEAQNSINNCSVVNANTAFNTWIQSHGGAVATDNCGLGGWSTIPANPVFNNTCNTPTTITFVVSDFCGNKDSTNATFSVIDTISPVLVQNATDKIIDCVTNPATSLEQWLNNKGGAIVTDNCIASADLLKSFLYNGEVKTIPQLKVILAAQLNGPTQIVNIGGQDLTVRAALNIQFKIADYCVHEVTTSAIFAVLDTTPPVITMDGLDTTTTTCALGSLDEDFIQWYSNGAGGEGMDLCDSVAWSGNPTMQEALDEIHSNPILCNQSISVNFHLVDASGNISVDSFTSVFRILDSSGPEFIDTVQDYQLVCSGGIGVQDSLESWINRKGNASIEDCNNGQWDHFSWADSQGNTGEGQYNSGPYPQISVNGCDQFIMVNFFAKDDCNNISLDSARFNLGDKEAPVASNIPQDTTISCGDNLPVGEPTFTDNCALSGNIVFTETSTYTPGLLTCTHFDYTITRTWMAQDECGNETTVIQTIEVVDTLAPTSDMPFIDLDLDCTDNIDDYLINFSDQCSSITVALDQSSSQGSDPTQCEYYNYLITQEFTVKDVCGNQSIFSRAITFIDSSAPEIDNSEPLVLNCTDSAQISTIIQSLASDNCASELTTSVIRIASGGSDDCTTGMLQKWVITASDPCGNSSEDTISVHLIDNKAPVIISAADDLTFYCGDGSDTETSFNNWINDMAGAIGADDCGETFSFIAVQGSYDINDKNTLPGKLPAISDIQSCTNGAVSQLNIDVVFYDHCYNTAVTSASYKVLDTIAPVLIYCPADTVIISSGNDCKADFILNLPAVLDLCANVTADSTMSSSVNVTSDNPGNSLTPVNPAIITFSGFNNNGAFASYASGGLTIEVLNGDIEGSLEFFNIYDEDNNLLGQTALSDAQCGNSSINIPYSESQFNNWLADGTIHFIAVPNDPSPQDGGFTINDICSGTRIEAAIPVIWNENASLKYSYKLDTNEVVDLDPLSLPILSLKEGIHTIIYEIKDCSENIITCTQSIQIKDTIAPVIVCGNDINLTLNEQTCEASIKVPLPISIFDNCGLANDFEFNVPIDTAAAWLTFAANPNLQNFIAQEKNYTFYNVGGNVTNPVLLNIFLKGDIESGGEYYTIFGEDGIALGTTEAGLGNVLTGNCNKVSTTYFNIPPAKFNQWAIDGSITLKAVANIDFTIPPGNNLSGINPCNPNTVDADGETDSTSYMFMQLKYSSYTPPSYFASGATTVPLTVLPPPFDPPAIDFKAGETYFSYVISDISGNSDTCTILVTVRDTIAPKAICKNATVHVHPSGIIPAILYPDQIDGGSFDNCVIDTMYVSPSSFTCADIGSQVEVTLFVVDLSGLIDSCKTLILVDDAVINPSYSLGLCDNDSLRLFANIPDTDLFDQYTYSWVGPNNFNSNVANPIIPNASSINSGSYKLTVTGFNGCGGDGVVQVYINDEINTPIIGAMDSSVCAGSGIMLFTQPYTGNIQYKWFEGQAPNGTLLDSTIVPQYSVTRTQGNYLFYVIISENDCISNPSASVSIEVMDIPVAIVDAAIIEVCEGGSIILGTPLTNYKYSWTGPNGFTSFLQYPTAITPATLNDAGDYSLVVNRDNCASETVMVKVTVSKRPPAPTPTSNGPVCNNKELRLTSNIISNVDSFIWKRPNGQLITTASNPLIISNAGSADNGLWTLILKSGGCTSLESLPLNVEVTQESEVVINYESPLCEGDSVRLTTGLYPGATYKWSGPAGFTSTATNPKVKAAFGTYSVTITTSAGCIAIGSVQLDLNIKPKITNITSDAENCQFPDDLINFNYTTSITEGELSFFWKGPGGFQSTDAHPTITPALGINGIYSLVVTSALGCKSDTAKITISISIAPAQPIIQGEAKVCSGSGVTLTAANLPVIGKYIWSTPAGDVTTTANTINIANVQQANSGDYTVIFVQDNCQSKPSNPFNVNVVNTPPQPLIIGDPTVCLNDSIILEISNPPNYTYQWTGPGGMTSSQKKWIIFPAQSSNAGSYFLTLVNDGCTSVTSDAFQLTINLPPAAPLMAEPIGSICVNEEGAVLTLCVTPGSATPGANYTFYNSALTQPIGGPTNGLCINVTDFNSFINGNNSFYAIAALNTCASAQSIPVAVVINRPPEENAVTGKVKYACDGNTTTLQANSVFIAKGTWTPLTAGVLISSPNDPNTTVTNLASGKNVFVWSLDYKDCLNYSRDTMIVWVPGEITSLDDIFRMKESGEGFINVLVNDNFNTPISLDILNDVKNGSVEIQDDKTILYIPNGSSDFDKFTYQICVAGCPQICAHADVLIDIDKVNDCSIPNIITPNNDRVNDVLRISCLEDFAVNNSKLAIFNEWGSMVYEAAPYKNDWDGKFKGSDLPSGTYFYVFDAGDGSTVQKGFLIIKR